MSLEFTLQREPSAHQTTYGVITGPDGQTWQSLEDEVRPDGVKVPGLTAIPAGRYEIIITRSKRFGFPLPLLLNVPNFEGIRIHGVRNSEDTQGCIGVGLRRVDDGSVPALFGGPVARKNLQHEIALGLASGQRVYITIADAPSTVL